MEKNHQSDGGPFPSENIPDTVIEEGATVLSEQHHRIHQYISQETRNDIVQVLLGHPQHCASVTELAYYISKSRSTIRTHLDDLAARDILQKYRHAPNEDHRDLPTNFWGFTPTGIQLLDELGYLDLLPLLRAVHDATERSMTVERHQSAARPALPATVTDHLSYEEPPEECLPEEAGTVDCYRGQLAYEDRLAANYDRSDGGRSLDDLF